MDPRHWLCLELREGLDEMDRRQIAAEWESRDDRGESEVGLAAPPPTMAGILMRRPSVWAMPPTANAGMPLTEPSRESACSITQPMSTIRPNFINQRKSLGVSVAGGTMASPPWESRKVKSLSDSTPDMPRGFVKRLNS
mmetsp:Transcript_118622/g.340555  ORF Transcript_118622/g.340555 Transcript_118622/m.340555 type:complete len:139 (+) Transcript_118622:615-1031(+)